VSLLSVAWNEFVSGGAIDTQNEDFTILRSVVSVWSADDGQFLSLGRRTTGVYSNSEVITLIHVEDCARLPELIVTESTLTLDQETAYPLFSDNNYSECSTRTIYIVFFDSGAFGDTKRGEFLLL
jgi:hypothetical protein